MKNRIRKTFDAAPTAGLVGSFIVPGGVRSITLEVFSRKFGTLSIGLGPTACIDANGELYTWGSNPADGTTISKSSPVIAVGQRIYRQVSMVSQHGMMLTNLGDAYAYGTGTHGRLGNANTMFRSTPILVLGGLKWRYINAADSFSFGITTNGDLYAWGYNNAGQLGLGDTTPRSTPVAVVTSQKFHKVVGSQFDGFENFFAVGIAENGDLYSWGSGFIGQLGTGSTSSVQSPVAVAGGIKAKDIAVSRNHVIVIDEDGVPWGWGRNTNGELGAGNLGGTNTTSTPVLVLGNLRCKQVACGGFTSYFLTEDGDIYATGLGNSGRLGDGNGSAHSVSTPQLVLGNRKYVEIAATDASVLALGEDGLLYAWGWNHAGELGLGDTTPRSTPTLVLGNRPWDAITEPCVTRMSMAVTPGETYQVRRENGMVTFGGRPIAPDVGRVRVVVEYFG